MPLALAQAAAYVRDTACGFGYYLGKFRERWTEFDAEQEAERGYGRTVAVTLGMALDRLREQNDEAAEEVLHRCAFLAPDSIPRELLTGEEIDERAVGRAITVLRRYSLVETAPGLVSLHRLVQRAVRERLSEQERATQSRGALRSCFRRFLDPNDYRTWDGCRAVLTHALQAVEHAEALGEAAVMRSWLLDRVGTYLRQTGELAEARRCLERALRNEAKAHGAVHEIVALLGQIVPAFRDLRAPAEARRPEFGIWNLGARAAAGRGAPGTAAEARRCLARSPLGRSLGGMDGHAATEVSRWLERPLCQDVKVPAPKPENLALAPYDIAITHDTLGLVLRDLGELAEARNCVERALHLKELAYGPEHPQVAITLDNLGLVLQDLGDSAAARSCHERALQLKEKAYGPEHAEVAITLGNLGLVLADLGELAEARRCQERALQLKEKAYGADHPEVAITLGNLGLVLQDLGEMTAARGSLERGLRIDEKLFGTDHPYPAITMACLGDIARLEGNFPESRAHLERALPAIERGYGADHVRVARVLSSLGLVARDEGHSAEARTKLERALSIVRARLGDEHHETARIRKLLQSVPDPANASPPAVPQAPAIKLLFLSAVPLGRSALNIKGEIQAIRKKIAASRQEERFQFIEEADVRLDALPGLLTQHQPHIVHFIGHGTEEGNLLLLREDGEEVEASPALLAAYLRNLPLGDNLRIALFNCCHSHRVARAAMREIDCAIGMADELPDQAAPAFASDFYLMLASGTSVKEAYETARLRMSGEPVMKDFTTLKGAAVVKNLVRLRTRRGVKPAQVILVPDTTTAGGSESVP